MTTARGWLVVESNARWLALATDGRPIAIAELEKMIADGRVADPPTETYRSFGSVIGPYSRQGRFYPPCTPVPDINYHQFVQNLVDG